MNSYSDEGGVFYSIDNYYTKILLDSTEFLENSSKENLISAIYTANFMIKNVTLRDNKNMLFFLPSSNLYFEQSYVGNLECTNLISGCLAYASELSTLTIKEMIFKNISHLLLEGGIKLDHSFLKLDKANFFLIRNQERTGSCIFGSFSSVFINYSIFEDFDSGCIYLQNSILEINSSFFLKLQRKEDEFRFQMVYSCILCDTCSSFKLSSSVFYMNKFADKGGAISLILSDRNQRKLIFDYSISECFFLENQAFEDGGAIYFIFGSLTIRNCSFILNQAKNGGAIFYQNQFKHNFLLFLLTSFFYLLI